MVSLGCESMPSLSNKVWTQPGKTEAQIRQDWAHSQLVAQRGLVGIQPPILFSENNFAAGHAIAVQRDARADAKKLAPLTMQSLGYVLVPVAQVPAGQPYVRP
jgi:hypothetical protein